MTLNCFSNWNGRITISVIDQIHQTSRPFCKDTGYFKCSKQTHTCTHMWVRKIEEDSQLLLLRNQTASWAPGSVLGGCSGDKGAGIILASGSAVTFQTTFPGPRPAFYSGLCPHWTGDPGVQQGVMGGFHGDRELRRPSQAGSAGWHGCSHLLSLLLLLSTAELSSRQHLRHARSWPAKVARNTSTQLTQPGSCSWLPAGLKKLQIFTFWLKKSWHVHWFLTELV